MPNEIGNPFDYRRFGNIFGGQGASRASVVPQNAFMDSIRRVQPTPPTQPAQGQDPLLAMLQRMQGGQATQAYREHVGNIPQPDDYAPSKWRRLGGALAAAGAAFGRNPNAGAIGKQITDAPLRGAVEEWQMKGAGLKEQADLEAQDVQGQIKYLTAVREMEKDRRANEIAEEKLEIDRQNANTMETYRQGQIANLKDQGWKEMTGPDGNIFFAHPNRPGERREVGPSIQTTNLANKKQELADTQTRLGYEGRRVATGEAGQRTYQQAVAGFINPEQQGNAEAQAVRDVVLNNPQWAKWGDAETGMVKETAGTFWDTDVKSPDYQAFRNAIEAKKAEILQTQRPLGGMGRGTMLPPKPPSINDLPD